MNNNKVKIANWDPFLMVFHIRVNKALKEYFVSFTSIWSSMDSNDPEITNFIHRTLID